MIFLLAIMSFLALIEFLRMLAIIIIDPDWKKKIHPGSFLLSISNVLFVILYVLG